MLTDPSGLLTATLLAPVVFALVALLWGRLHVRVVGYAGAAVAGFAFLCTVVLAVQAGRDTPVAVALGSLVVSVDRLSAVLLLLVFGVSTVVQSFAVRYLAGDPQAVRFAAAASLLTAASAGLVSAATLLALALCWTLAGAALCVLLGMYWHLPAARDGVRRTAIAFLIGDLALWTAVALVTLQWGTVDLRALNAGQAEGPLLAAVGCLVVLAALSRSAQMPFHRWLPATLAAPTPVSALLHAGVVNAGGILLVRMAPLVSGDLARGLTIVAGAATLTYGAVIMQVKPDIKGALANSTMAQMGFMILTCGLGLWAATVFHLVAHGFYKATLFLSSGSAIAARRRAAARPPAPAMSSRRRVATVVTAMALPALALYAAIEVVGSTGAEHAAERALLIFAWVTGAAATWGWLRRRRGPGAVIAAAAVLLPMAFGYLALVSTVSGYLTPALPFTAPSAVLVWLVVLATAAVLAGLALLRRLPATALHRVVYVHALSAGHIPAPLPAQLKGARS